MLKTRTTRATVLACIAAVFVTGRPFDDVRAQQVDAPTDDLSKAVQEIETLQEVIVTAQKREEPLQEVPVPVTAISAQSLLDNDQVRIQDYYTRVPGLSVAPDQLEGTSRITIRGLTTGGLSNPTVGIVVDDVPYGSSTGIGSGYLVPDIDPSDLQRIEVLRGPQGTLYGASSMGGLLKYVTVDPSTDSLSGRIEADLNNVYNGDGIGYGVRGAVNIPLSDTLAVRASGFSRRDPGYIDNPILHLDGVNRLDVSGGRLAALWKPSPDLSLKLSALLQDSNTNGTSFAQTGFGDLEQGSARGAGGYHLRLQAYSAAVKAKLGIFDLTSVTGYNITRNDFTFDLTSFFAPNQFVLGYPSPSYVKSSKVTQEIRLTAPLGERIDWLIGGFYTHEDTPQTQSILASNFMTGVPSGVLLDIDFPSDFEEYSAFSDFTFHLTDRLDLQVGGRESENHQSYSQTESGSLVGEVLTQPTLDSKDNSFTYLVTPRFKLSPDLMVYGRFASGYRPGGPNTNIGLGVPSEYSPDKTLNYEVGLKGDVLAQVISYEASLYYIDWRNIQLKLVSSTDEGYTANGGGAKSEGVELSGQAKPFSGMTVGGWLTFNEAVLTQNFPPLAAAYGLVGDRLPDSSRFSGNLSLEEALPLVGDIKGVLGGDISYFSDSEGQFTPTSLRQSYPAYAKTNLHAGAKSDTWRVTVFVNNLADKRAALSGGLGSTFVDYFQYITPRTIGLTASRNFW